MSDDAEHSEAHQDRKAPPVRRLRLRFLMRAFGEIGIVTVGILIAFALDAWWDNRSLARREQVHLRALASDFQQNVDILEKMIRLEESVAASSHELLLRAQARAPSSSESLTQLIRNVFNSGRYEPVMGAYEALVNSAGLTLIQDDELRAALAQFAARVNDNYAENWSNEHYFAFAREFGGRIVLGFHESTSEVDRARDFEELLRDPSFHRQLAMRYFSERDMAREYADLLQQAETVLAQVRKQIRQ